MSLDYQKLQIKRFPSLSGRKTAESRYWRRFKFPILIKEYAAVTSIDFSPTLPHDFAVTSSTRIQVYSPRTHTVIKTFSRFNDVVYSGKFRRDGKLIVAGDETGLVQVFDVDTKSILRSFKNHEGPVHVAQFSLDNIHIFSAADDKTVRCWDLPTGSLLTTFDEHQDYVRAGATTLDHPNLCLTGSYDRTVKLWDIRSPSSVITLNHEHPVESVLMFPNGGMALSAGSNIIKVWDMLRGGRPVYSFSNHQKTITSMCFDSSCSRLISASLDHHIKIYSTQDFKTMHSVKYPAPLLSVSISPDDTHLVTGMANGILSIRQRLVKTEDLSKNQEWKNRLHAGTYRYFVRGKSHLADPQDFLVTSSKKPKLRKYEAFLRKFQYKNALDASLLPVSCRMHCHRGSCSSFVISLMSECMPHVRTLSSSLKKGCSTDCHD